jgi:hypothetical protein
MRVCRSSARCKQGLRGNVSSAIGGQRARLGRCIDVATQQGHSAHPSPQQMHVGAARPNAELVHKLPPKKSQ